MTRCLEPSRSAADLTGGLQRPLRISRRNDATEREADCLANAALRRPGMAELPNDVPAAARPLSIRERAYFEPRFGHDFGAVRVYADHGAAEQAAALQARAFTIRSHIAFGAGQYRSDEPAGRALMAHELAHVVQADRGGVAATTLHRAPLTTAGRDIDFIDRIYSVRLAISADPTVFANPVGSIESGIADLTERPVYARDVFTLTPRFSEGGDLTGPLSWRLPPELERVSEVGDHGIQLRVPAGTMPGIFEAKVGASDSPRMLTVRIRVEALPADPDAVDPRLRANLTQSAALQEQRRSSREEYCGWRRKAAHSR